MKAVIQRVAHASVVVDGVTVGSCKKGYMILLGVAEGDSELDAELLCRKIPVFTMARRSARRSMPECSVKRTSSVLINASMSAGDKSL